MINFGPIPIGAVLPVFFDSFAGSTGASVTITGLAVTDIEIYKGTSMTQRSSDAGYTLLDTDGIDIDGITGIHGFSIDTGDNTDAGFYASGSFYTVVVSAITVDSQTVNFVAATFRCVTAEGVAGQPKVDTAAFGGTAGTFSGGRPEVNASHIAGSAVSTSSAQIGVNVVNAGGTAWGSGAITAGSIASNAITSAKIATDAIGAAQIADNAIDAGAIATDAITAAKIADGAIDLATFAADAKALFGVIAFGTAQSVTGTTIRLASAETFADDELIGATVLIRSASTGAGQSRVITDYVSATDTATVDTWTTTPTGTITYVVFGTAPSSTTAPIAANVTQWAGSAVATPSVAGVPEVDLTHVAGSTTNVSALATNVDAILTDTAEIGAAGAGLTNINLPDQTMNITGNITGNLSGSVGSVTGAVGSVTGAVGSVTGLTASDVAAIKAKTDSLTFTVAGQVDANIQYVNDVAVTGTGAPGDEWGP